MLIDKEEWAMLSSNYNKIKNYILIYAFGHLTPTMKQFVEKLSRQTACAIVIISYALKKPIKAMCEKQQVLRNFGIISKRQICCY